jgi:hypothetical protein
VSEVLGGEAGPVEELVEAFEFCQTPADFAAAVEGYSSELVKMRSRLLIPSPALGADEVVSAAASRAK